MPEVYHNGDDITQVIKTSPSPDKRDGTAYIHMSSERVGSRQYFEEAKRHVANLVERECTEGRLAANAIVNSSNEEFAWRNTHVGQRTMVVPGVKSPVRPVVQYEFRQPLDANGGDVQIPYRRAEPASACEQPSWLDGFHYPEKAPSATQAVGASQPVATSAPPPPGSPMWLRQKVAADQASFEAEFQARRRTQTQERAAEDSRFHSRYMNEAEQDKGPGDLKLDIDLLQSPVEKQQAAIYLARVNGREYPWQSLYEQATAQREAFFNDGSRAKSPLAEWHAEALSTSKVNRDLDTNHAQAGQMHSSVARDAMSVAHDAKLQLEHEVAEVKAAEATQQAAQAAVQSKHQREEVQRVKTEIEATADARATAASYSECIPKDAPTYLSGPDAVKWTQATPAEKEQIESQYQ